jgi:hypothetical protein
MFTRTRNRILQKSVESRPYAITVDNDPYCCYLSVYVYTLRTKFSNINSVYKRRPGVSNRKGARVKRIILKFKAGRTPFYILTVSVLVGISHCINMLRTCDNEISNAVPADARMLYPTVQRHFRAPRPTKTF